MKLKSKKLTIFFSVCRILKVLHFLVPWFLAIFSDNPEKFVLFLLFKPLVAEEITLAWEGEKTYETAKEVKEKNCPLEVSRLIEKYSHKPFFNPLGKEWLSGCCSVWSAEVLLPAGVNLYKNTDDDGDPPVFLSPQRIVQCDKPAEFNQ